MRLLCVLVVSGVLVAGCASSPLSRSVEQLVDEAVSPAVAGDRFAGVVLVKHEGRVLVRKGYGFADLQRRIPNAPSTRFMIMSVSKQSTAALIARLAARGLLRFDDPVSKYLDDWPELWRGVQVRHLLSHSSGLDIDTTYFWLVKHHPRYWPEAGVPPPYEPKALLAEPGTAFRYANVGYTLLSMIAERAGNASFDELLKTEVFTPLGMRETVPERETAVPGRARGYHRAERGLEISEQKTTDIVGAGDLVSTVEDIARFDAGFDTDSFLPPSIRREMLTGHVRSPQDFELGYGWFLRTTSGGRQVQYHTGAGAGFRGFNYRLPAERLVIVVLANVDEAQQPWLPPLVDRIADVLDTTR